MPQEFCILKCFSCSTYQVHIVKKAKVWSCKMCGEKQSIIKVLWQGSAKCCREQVQKLNFENGIESDSVTKQEEAEEIATDSSDDQTNSKITPLNDAPIAKSGLQSKWACFLDSEDD